MLEILKQVEKKCYRCEIGIIKKKNSEDLSGGGRPSVGRKGGSILLMFMC